MKVRHSYGPKRYKVVAVVLKGHRGDLCSSDRCVTLSNQSATIKTLCKKFSCALQPNVCSHSGGKTTRSKKFHPCLFSASEALLVCEAKKTMW